MGKLETRTWWRSALMTLAVSARDAIILAETRLSDPKLVNGSCLRWIMTGVQFAIPVCWRRSLRCNTGRTQARKSILLHDMEDRCAMAALSSSSEEALPVSLKRRPAQVDSFRTANYVQQLGVHHWGRGEGSGFAATTDTTGGRANSPVRTRMCGA